MELSSDWCTTPRYSVALITEGAFALSYRRYPVTLTLTLTLTQRVLDLTLNASVLILDVRVKNLLYQALFNLFDVL